MRKRFLQDAVVFPFYECHQPCSKAALRRSGVIGSCSTRAPVASKMALALAEDHLAYFVSDVVEQLDLSAIESVYEAEERGQPPYHPRMMTKILIYGYCVGVFSSRRMQKKLTEDVGFRVLAAGNEPDFRTISDFRKLHLTALQGLF